MFFPMFEVGVANVSNEIQDRLNKWIDQIFNFYEDRVFENSQALCYKYDKLY